jgi:GTP-binding protein
VGKSTLIASVSAAKPKIANYPFTTLEPHLGVVRWPKNGPTNSEFVMADIPGLIEGAAEGKGLGLEFLRHIERAKVLLFLLDLGEDVVEPPERQLEILRQELGDYLPELLDRPSLVVGSKSDLTIEEAYEDAPIAFAISAATHHNLDQLLGQLLTLVEQSRAVEATEDVDYEVVIHRPVAEQASAMPDGHGGWNLVGRQAERAVGLSDLSNPAAMDEVVRRLEKLGIDRLLQRAGARDGDVVTIGDFQFTWYRAGSSAAIDAAMDVERRSRRKTRRERSS